MFDHNQPQRPAKKQNTKTRKKKTRTSRNLSKTKPARHNNNKTTPTRPPKAPPTGAIKQPSNNTVHYNSTLPTCTIIVKYLHEEIGDPHGVEEVARSLQLVSVVLLEVEEGNNVRVPGLQVYCDRPLPLPASLHTHETKRFAFRVFRFHLK